MISRKNFDKYLVRLLIEVMKEQLTTEYATLSASCYRSASFPKVGINL